VFNPREAELHQLISGSVFLMLFMAIAIVIFFVVYQKRLLNEQRRLQKIQNDYQRQLLNASIAVQEKERIRIGQDLHDEIGSSLSAISMLISQLPQGQAAEVQLVLRIREGLSDIIKDVRNISNNLFPAVLSRFGLADALQHLADLLSCSHALAIELNIDSEFKLSFDNELAIYRILQELINNVIKHADARNLFIRLNQSNGNVLIIVRDDGCGFNIANISEMKHDGIGLKGIQARVAAMQADFKMVSGINEGTIIEINIPIDAKQD
jgi:signal transduction histidine kinase